MAYRILLASRRSVEFERMMQISSMKFALLALVIATYVEPSASPPQDDGDFEVFDSDEFQESEYPRDSNALKEKAMRKSEDYYNYEDSPQVKDKDMSKSDYYDNHEDDSPHVKHKMSSDRKHKDKDMRKSDYYDNNEDDSPHVKHKMSSDRKHKDTYKSIFNEEAFMDYLPAASEKAKGNPKSELDFKRMIQFPWMKSRKGKQPNGASKIKNQFCRISPPTERPGGCHRSTTDRCSSTISLPPSTPSCPYTSKPTAPPPAPMSPSPPPPPTPKPPPCPPDQSSKCPQKPKFKKLKPKTAKKLLKLILDTKQHVLFMLEILNHLENEVLFRSPDSSHRQYCKMKTEAAQKGRAVPKKKSAKPHKKQAKPEKQAKMQSYGEYHRKGNPYMPMARANNKLRQKEHLAAAIDPEDNWRPAVSSQANRAKNFMENTLQPSGLSKHSHKKYRHHGQKQQPKMKNIPPGMVAILT